MANINKENLLTQEYVKELLDYKDGYLYWRVKNVRAGSLHRRPQGDRYRIGINGKSYMLHRIVFFWHYGLFPVVVDHIDRNTLNNNINNLRAATIAENSKNRISRPNSSSRYLGVALNKGKYWQADIYINGRSKYLGCFKTEAEAALCYNEAAKKHHGEFANLNIITW